MKYNLLDIQGNPNNVIQFPKRGLANGNLAVVQYGMREEPSEPSLDNCIDDVQNPTENMPSHRNWCVVGYDADGEPIKRQVSGKTQYDLCDNITRAMLNSDRRDEFLADIIPLQSENKAPAPMFEEYVEAWYSRYKKNVFEECTKVTTRTNLNSLYSYFKNKRLDEISVDSVQDYMNEMGSKGACKETISQRRKTLSQILEAAREDSIIPMNPASSKRLRNPGITGKGITALTKRQTCDLMEALPNIADDRARAFVAIMLYTGVRREEALALKWEKIDFSRPAIKIDMAVTFPIDKPVFKPTKTKAGNRLVPMPDALVEILKPLRKESGFVICDKNGDSMTKTKIKKLSKEIKKSLGWNKFDCRILRHTYATRQIEASIPMKIVSENLGHADIQTTLNIYTQLDMEYKLENRNKAVEYTLRNPV